uniref:Uncharacterized protein n=1 Tax=Leersia perrieri TaxID=77586 RepID=A0A0D9XYJ5_9ORYZ
MYQNRKIYNGMDLILKNFFLLTSTRDWCAPLRAAWIRISSMLLDYFLLTSVNYSCGKRRGMRKHPDAATYSNFESVFCCYDRKATVRPIGLGPGPTVLLYKERKNPRASLMPLLMPIRVYTNSNSP